MINHNLAQFGTKQKKVLNRRDVLIAAGSVALTTRSVGHAARRPDLTDVTFLRPEEAAARGYFDIPSRASALVPELRAICTSSAGVSNALAWARDQGLDFAIRSGGHCFEGFSQHPKLVIDLREMKSIRYDAAAHTVTVGAATHLGPLARALAQNGVSVPAGICPTVAMAGYALGGGIGYLGRRDGLLADQLLSLRLVTASGELINVSASNHPDLFWACRGGGGGNFGIVTELTFRTQPIPDLRWVRIVQPVDAVRAAEILFLWQHRCQQWPRHTTLHLRISRRTDTTFLMVLEGLSGWSGDDLTQELSLLMRMDADTARRGIFSGTPVEVMRRMLPDGGGTQADLLNHSHLFDGPMGERGTLDVLSELLNHPHGRIHLNVEPLGGAIADAAADATAFPHRSTSFAIQSQVLLRKDDDRNALTTANEAMRKVLEPRSNGGVYVNYPDRTLMDWGRKYWGANLPRLKAIKRRYDPDSIFDHAHSLSRA